MEWYATKNYRKIHYNDLGLYKELVDLIEAKAFPANPERDGSAAKTVLQIGVCHKRSF